MKTEIKSLIAALNLPPSLVVKSQKKVYRADYQTKHGPETLIATVRWDDQCGNGHNSFSVTCSIYSAERISGETTIKHESGKILWCGGCQHEEITKRIPEIAHLIRWHLFDPSGPMHYVSNTVYLAGERDCHGLLKGEFRQHFSRGKYQADGIEGVPHWELRISGMPDSNSLYSVNKPEAPSVKAEWVPSGRTGEGKARDLIAARSAAAWPDATDEDLTAPELEERLIARLPALVDQMKADIEAIGFVY